MRLEKIFHRNEQISQCLRSLEGRDDHSVLDALQRPYRELVAAQERLLNAAERMADSLRRMG